ncbi:Alternative cytochrome c oxidase subunit 2 [bacterium HR30]|nr:Alternative cytochrome c oxidase subunit 2 [bacterium HR30]
MDGFHLESMGSGWWPQASSSFAEEVDGLFLLIAITVGAWFVLCQVAMWFLLWRARRQRHPLGEVSGEPQRENWSIVSLGLAVLVCDLVIEAYGHPIWRRMVSEPPENALAVRVEARQFVWEIRHAGADGRLDTEDDLEVQNELHVPLGRPVELRLRSRDVIHSFFLPTARLKQDVLPGVEIRRWFVPTQVGRFPIACAELCGFAHYRMGGELIVHDEESYRHWLASGNALTDGGLGRGGR